MTPIRRSQSIRATDPISQKWRWELCLEKIQSFVWNTIDASTVQYSSFDENQLLIENLPGMNCYLNTFDSVIGWNKQQVDD